MHREGIEPSADRVDRFQAADVDELCDHYTLNAYELGGSKDGYQMECMACDGRGWMV